MKDIKTETGKINPQSPEFISARRKLEHYAFDKTLEEYKKDNTIDFQKRKEEIVNEELLKLKKKMQERQEKDLLSGINRLVDRNSNVDARYRDLISEEAYEKLEIRNKADRILEELKKQQREKEKQSKKVKPSTINKDDEIRKQIEEAEQAKKIENIKLAQRRAETLRRANYNKEKKRYDDRQGKLNNFVEQLTFISKSENEPVQTRTSTVQRKTPVQYTNVHPSNVQNQNLITERVVIKEVESKPAPTPKKDEKPVQALVPKKQKRSFMDRIHGFGTKVSEVAITAYEMLTFKHSRDVAVGKHKERSVSPAEASSAYEKNIKYADSKQTFDVRSKNENKTTSFFEHLQAKADEKVAMEAMKSKSKNENSRNSDQRGA